MHVSVLVFALLTAQPSAQEQQPLRWTGCDIARASFMEAAAQAFEKKTGIHVELEDGGATKGIREVAAKKAALGGTCRHAMNVPEERGVKLVPVAWDALVIAVHPSNPVKNITLEQVKDVYSGKITRWSQLGGKDVPIVAMERKGKSSGVGAGARMLIFHDPEYEYAPAVKLFESTRPLEEALEQTPDGIGITGVSSARHRRVRMVAVEGKEPTRENVVSGDYLLYRPLYLSLPTATPDPRASRFLEFLLSPEGQAVVRSTGTVSLEEGKLLWAKFKAQYRSN